MSVFVCSLSHTPKSPHTQTQTDTQTHTEEPEEPEEEEFLGEQEDYVDWYALHNFLSSHNSHSLTRSYTLYIGHKKKLNWKNMPNRCVGFRFSLLFALLLTHTHHIFTFKTQLQTLFGRDSLTLWRELDTGKRERERERDRTSFLTCLFLSFSSFSLSLSHTVRLFLDVRWLEQDMSEALGVFFFFLLLLFACSCSSFLFSV